MQAHCHCCWTLVCRCLFCGQGNLFLLVMEHGGPLLSSVIVQEISVENLKVSFASDFFLTNVCGKTHERTPAVSWCFWLLAHCCDQQYNFICQSARFKNSCGVCSFFSDLGSHLVRKSLLGRSDLNGYLKTAQKCSSQLLPGNLLGWKRCLTT